LSACALSRATIGQGERHHGAPVILCAASAPAVGHLTGAWEFVRVGDGLLLSGNLDTYAFMPTAQLGPPALVLEGTLPGTLYLGTACLLFPPVLF
jgi:hypothetical protein